MTFDPHRFFWQQRELERLLDNLRPQIGAFDELVSSQYFNQLQQLQDSLTLPPEYLQQSRLIEDAIAHASDFQISDFERLGVQATDDVSALLRQANRFDDIFGEFENIKSVIRDSLIGTEALLELGRLPGSQLQAALLPQAAFGEFAELTLGRMVDLPDLEHEIVRDAIEAGAHLLDAMTSGVEHATLMYPDLSLDPLPVVNVYSELSRFLAEVDFGQPERPVEELVAESPPASVVELAGRIIRLVYDINTEREREGKDPTFKPTNKSMFALAVLPLQVTIDEQGFIDLLDHLYFLLYEGSGTANRLTGEVSDKALSPLWLIKTLRLGARHDVDHGRKAKKKTIEIGDAYRSLIGAVSPKGREDWMKAQAELYRRIVSMLETIWYGEET